MQNLYPVEIRLFGERPPVQATMEEVLTEHLESIDLREKTTVTAIANTL